MACRWVKMSDGTVMIVCGVRNRRCQETECSTEAVCQCDNPVIRKGVAASCDRYACRRHSTAVAKERDLCARHAASSMLARAAPREAIPDGNTAGGPIVLWHDYSFAGRFARVSDAAAFVAGQVSEPDGGATPGRWEVSCGQRFFVVEQLEPERRVRRVGHRKAPLTVPRSLV